MKNSSFDRVTSHLKDKGAETAAPDELVEDVETLVRRCDEVRSLAAGLGGVELSPYMKTLLRVSGMDAPVGAGAGHRARTAAAGF